MCKMKPTKVQKTITNSPDIKNLFDTIEQQNLGRWLPEPDGRKVVFELEGRLFRFEEKGIRRIK